MREPPATFADIALALQIAAPKLQRDIGRMIDVAERISLSQMGLEVSIADLKHDFAMVQLAAELFKAMAEVEPQVRAVLARKASRRWSDFARVAVV